MNNITIKKANGTTDVIYTGVTVSAGDSSPAVYRNDTVGTTLAERPSLLISSRSNGPKSARRVDVNYTWPIMSQDAGGNKILAGRMVGSASVLIPQNQDAALINEQAFQFGNLMATTIVKAALSSGYAPRD